MYSSGILSTSVVKNSVSFLNSFATTVSTGKINFTLFISAFLIKSLASSTLSSSKSELPVLYPFALRKVYIIPPPINILSAILSKFSITDILSETFAPPKIAVRGLLGSFNAFPIISTSFSTKNPSAEGRYSQMPTFEECAL